MMEVSESSTDHHHLKNDEHICSTEEAVAEDLILEILLRLPPVSVLKFKSVSKSWYSLITNPCFLQNHAHARLFQYQRRLNPLVLLSNVHPHPSSNYRDTTKHRVYAIPTQDQDEPPFLKVFLDHSLAAFRKRFSRCVLVDSCNGLLLYHATNPNLDTRYQYVVFNPITNQHSEVPIMDLIRTFKKPILLNYPHIVFDPTISLSYKVLTVVPGSRGRRYRLYVYSSDTGSWRLLTRFIAKLGVGKRAFMFNGVFYWLLTYDASICFDVVKENVWLLPLPPRPRDEYREVFYFGECGGRLRLINEYFTYDIDSDLRFPFSIDIMEKDLCSTVWTMKFRVIIEGGDDHLNRARNDPFYGGNVRIMHLYQTERGAEVVLLIVDQRRIVSFNITTNTYGNELTFRHFKQAKWLNAFPFTPTLFPLLT